MRLLFVFVMLVASQEHQWQFWEGVDWVPLKKEKHVDDDDDDDGDDDGDDDDDDDDDDCDD